MYVDAMVTMVEFRVMSELEGHISEFDKKEEAENFAEYQNNLHGVPSDHYVQKHVEVL